MLPWTVQFLHFTLKPTGGLEDCQRGIRVMCLGKETYISGPVTESFKEGSGGKIDLSSHCPLKGALAL